MPESTFPESTLAGCRGPEHDPRQIGAVIDYTSVSDYTVADGTIMLLENLEKVLEKLATPDRLTIVIEAPA
jgi:hypothetical protein